MLDFIWGGFNNSSNYVNNEPRRNPPQVIVFQNPQQQGYRPIQQNFQTQRYCEPNSIADNFVNGNLFFPSKVVKLSHNELRSNLIDPKLYLDNQRYLFKV